MTKKLLLFLLLLSVGKIGYAQLKTDYTVFLDRQPNFIIHDTLCTDSLFLQDVLVLKHLAQFDTIASELLKKPVLSTLMFEEVLKGKPATYRTLIDYLSGFMRTDTYKDFASGVLLYRQMEALPVNPAHWDTDKMLFIRLGFTESDLDDFKEYMVLPAHQKMTYKQVFMSYMKDMEALGPVQH